MDENVAEGVLKRSLYWARLALLLTSSGVMLASISDMVIALVKSLARPDFTFKQRSDDPIRLVAEHVVLSLSCGYSPLVPSDVAKALESFLQMEVLHVGHPVTLSRMMGSGSCLSSYSR